MLGAGRIIHEVVRLNSTMEVVRWSAATPKCECFSHAKVFSFAGERTYEANTRRNNRSGMAGQQWRGYSSSRAAVGDRIYHHHV